MKRFKKITACILLAALLLSTLVMSSSAAVNGGMSYDWFSSESMLGRLMTEYFVKQNSGEAEQTDASMKLAGLTVDDNGNLISTENLATSASEYASVGSSKSSMNDGDASSAWKTNNSSATATLSWNSGKSFDELVISLFDTGDKISEIEVSYSKSGSSGYFTDVAGTRTGNTYTVSFAGITGIRRVRIELTRRSGASGNYGIYEIYANKTGSVIGSVKYFPVTLYNYSDSEKNLPGKTDINAAMKAIEIAANGGKEPSVWNGFYFNNGTPTDAEYGLWNYWTKYEPKFPNGKDSDVFTGIVANKLGANGTPVFVHGDAGVFDSTTTSKNIYTNVQMPFVYDSATGHYTYDSGKYSVFFENKVYASNATLSIDRAFTVGGLGEFFPFNVNGDSSPVHHFGMQAAVPFTMTANGRLIDNDDTSAPVTFSFSGDDDVWVFLDDTLALDIGGIHGEARGVINFQTNTVTVNGTVVSRLFDVEDANGNLVSSGILGCTRAEYSARGEHSLKIFYLERGKNASNCMISFNLPLNDHLDVTKKVDTSALLNPSAEQLESINNADYTFVLYENNVAAANVAYLLFNGDAFTGYKSTDANGRFTLKNGETARFPGQLTQKFRVEEIKPVGTYESISWEATWNGTVTGTLNYTDMTAQTYTSPATAAVSAIGTSDYATLTCTNVLDPYFLVVSSETFVLDYGLSVILDVLANDSQYAKQLILSAGTAPVYGTAVIVNRDAQGNYVPVPADQLNNPDATDYRYILYTPTSFIEGIDTISYSLITYGYNYETAQFETGLVTATATIIPATTVYYEENFGNEISFNDVDNGWTAINEASDVIYQESGIVAALGAQRVGSTYGTDSAYMQSVCKDSAGSSVGISSYASTAGKAAPYFTYTFTGTGTAVYMRTETNSGMIRVRVYDENGTEVSSAYISARQLYYAIDTVSNPKTGNSIYNVPVVDIDGLAYGTYTVKVTCLNYINGIMVNASGAPCNTFVLDGIKIYNPLGTQLPAAAEEAYTNDTENNVSYTSLRDKLLTDMTKVDAVSGSLVFDPNSFVLFTDADGAVVDPTEYLKVGPKNEVYLSGGQSVVFELENWFRNKPNDVNVYIGAKTPDGTDGQIRIGYYDNNNNFVAYSTINVTSTAESYFRITDYIAQEGYLGTVAIQVVSGGVVSLTDIKVTGRVYDVITND